MNKHYIKSRKNLSKLTLGDGVIDLLLVLLLCLRVQVRVDDPIRACLVLLGRGVAAIEGSNQGTHGTQGLWGRKDKELNMAPRVSGGGKIKNCSWAPGNAWHPGALGEER